MVSTRGHRSNEIESLLAAAKELEPAELPRLLGDLEEIRCTALARLTAPAPISERDELLGPGEAARRLGVSTDYLYRHHAQFPFTRRVGRKLLFSTSGIEKYIRQQAL